MREIYFDEAIVLDREDSGDFDSRYAVYAKGYGKFSAKSKSVRKITSKLAGHVEPGSLAKVRLVGNGAWQLVDALKYGKTAVASTDLYLLNQLLPEGDFDFSIWEILAGKGDPSFDLGQEFSWAKVLKILGWDSEHAICYNCGGQPVFFHISDQRFSCEKCLAEEVIGRSAPLGVRF